MDDNMRPTKRARITRIDLPTIELVQENVRRRHREMRATGESSIDTIMLSTDPLLSEYSNDGAVQDLQIVNTGISLLHAAESGDFDKVVKIVQAVKSSNLDGAKQEWILNVQDGKGLTALMFAAASENYELCKALIAAKVDLNAKNPKGYCALEMVAQKGNAKLAKLLVDSGTSMDLVNKSIISAAHFGFKDFVQTVLDHGVDPNFANEKGTTSLMRASQEGHAPVVLLLLKRGANVDQANGEGMTALMLASQRGHFSVLSLLLDHGANLDLHTNQGSTALMLATKRGHKAAVCMLVTRGADIFARDDRSQIAHDAAIRRGHTEISQMLTLTGQIRLMGIACRPLRWKMIQLLSRLYGQNRAEVAMPPKGRVSASTALLARSMYLLPETVLHLVAEYLPLPLMIGDQLNILRRRSRDAPDEAVFEGLHIVQHIICTTIKEHISLREIDENFDSSLFFISLKNLPKLAERLQSSPFCMRPDMIRRLTQFASIQMTYESFGSSHVRYGAPIGAKMIALFEDVYEWYDEQSFR